MGKRHQKRKNLFPWMAQENLFIPKTGREIVTDAGWEKIPFEDATKFFTLQTLNDWRESFLESVDIDDLISSQELDIDLDDNAAVDKFLDGYSPSEVNVVVAKAVYDTYAWVRVLLISNPDDEEYYFHNHEMEAIRLGVHLRKYLNDNSILIINDCQDAVRYLHGRYPNIGWQPRNCVSIAHQLKIAQATKVYNEQAWDDEWSEQEEEYLIDEEI